MMSPANRIRGVSCGEFNWTKRNQTADLRDKTVLLTGNSFLFCPGCSFPPLSELIEAQNHCICVLKLESNQLGPKLNALFV